MTTVLELVQTLEKGGRTKRILDTATGLCRSGWSVKVLSMAEPAPWVKAGYSGGAEWLSLQKRPGLDLLYIYRLVRLLRAEQVALIHAHCESSYFYGGIAAKLSGIPIVGTYHRSELAYFQPSCRLRTFARLLTAAVAISRDRMQLMTSQLGIPSSRITLVHGGVDLASCQAFDPDCIEPVKQKLGVERKRVLLSVGHLGPIKGHDVTIAAMARIRERWPDALLVIAGDGSAGDYRRLNDLVGRLNLAEHVRLLGQVHNVPEWLNICEFFVQPSIEEGFGLVFVEAGACRKAVVATAVGGIKDIIVDGQTGLLVEPRDADALAAAMDCLLQAPKRTSAFGEAGLHRVQASFSLDSMAAKYDGLFQNLVPQRNSNGCS
ncbi:glycosyltransferase family 4 protein [Haliea sp. E1-2-M8]|uniref:glycosyltransferase family 4 protein n=1 Tax=Haliea sp. E1-2-M8 TaxID=3064706 RepID=UPI002715F54C|nr:glycosyltransferase family 4 protein [Haliea sp. E1-2-M8]MDO8864236.1 glycosyltransferase family 4 protein [Haliea sp. E1-2-M8]